MMEFLITLLIFSLGAFLAGWISGTEEQDLIGDSHLFNDSSLDEDLYYSDSRIYDDLTDPTKCYLPYNIYHDTCFEKDSSLDYDYWDDRSSDDDIFWDDW